MDTCNFLSTVLCLYYSLTWVAYNCILHSTERFQPECKSLFKEDNCSLSKLVQCFRDQMKPLPLKLELAISQVAVQLVRYSNSGKFLERSEAVRLVSLLFNNLTTA